MRLARLFLPAAVLLAACSDESAVTPDSDMVPPPTALAVRDAATNGGQPGFYFLQPFVTDGAPTKPLNQDLLPSVEICRLVEITGGRPSERYPEAGTECEAVIQTFEINSFQPTEESFRLNWDTDDTNEPGGLDETHFYRVKVLIGNLELGFFDVNPQRPGANEVFPGVYSANVGSVIPIGFYIEEGALCTATDGTVIECIEFTCELVAQGCTFTLDGDGLGGSPARLGVSIPAQTEQFLTNEFGGAEYETFRFERLADNVPCFTDPDTGEEIVDSPAFGPCVRVTPLGPLGEPSFVKLKETATKSICIDYADVTDANGVRRPYQMLKQGEDGTIKALAAVPSTVCGDPLQTALNDSEPRSVLGRLAQAFRPVTRIFSPRPLRAIDLGRGGEMEEFSTFRYHLGYELQYVEGSGGIGRSGDSPSGPLPKVQAVDEKGIPVGGATVHFAVLPDGNGSVTQMSVTTGADGFASLDAWVLGARGTNTVVASSYGGYTEGCFPLDGVNPCPDEDAEGTVLSFSHMMSHDLRTGAVTFGATAIGDPAALNPAGTTVLQPEAVSTELTLDVTVLDAELTDITALGVPGETVTWKVLDGNGVFVIQNSDGSETRVTELETVTNADGIASVLFQVGTTAGDNTVTATVNGLGSTTFTVVGNPGPAAEVFKVSGDGQVAKIGTTLPADLVVEVQDEYDNVISGAVVTWTTDGGASITDDGNSATFTLGSTAGDYTATATFGSLSAVFTATACGPGLGLGTASVDGVLDSDEWFCAKSEDLEVNLGGGLVEAKIYWMNDSENVYFGVWVNGADKVNSLRIDFDNEGDGVFVAGEDAINFDPSLAEADRYTDEYLTVQCANRSQAGCGGLDPVAHGSGAFDNASGVTVYEFSKPLDSGDAEHDFVLADLNANPLGVGISGFVTFRVGNGAKGNTQWPGFRVPHFFELYPVF